MKLLLFIDSLVGAGAQRQLVNLATGLRARGHGVTVATYAPKTFFLDALRAADVRYLNYGKAFRFDPSPAWRLGRTVSRESPDCLVAFLRTPSVYAELVKLVRPALPLIVSERGGVDLGGFSRADRVAGLGHRVADHVVTNSHDYLRCLVAAHPALASRSRVIYNGLSDRFLELGAARLAGQGAAAGPAEAAGPTGAVTRFCTVAARANHQKSPMTLVRAAATLLERGTDAFTIDWVGPVDFDAPLVRSAVREIEERGLGSRWRWAGLAADVAEVYPRYDALVSPSRYEGVANTMCEAMCSALPVVVTDVADNARVLEGGRHGLLCPADDPAALADRMARFVAMSAAERRELAIRARDRATELFSMAHYLDEWEALCASVSRKRG